MYLEPRYEIIKSIENLLESSVSAATISKSCDISYTTISELKNQKREIENVSFSILMKLYNFSIDNHLDNAYLQKEKQKGRNQFVTVELPLKKILVSFEDLDLMALGYSYFKNENKKILNEPIRLIPSKSLLITKDNHYYDASEFDLSFQCSYGGTGPNAFVNFIENYSNIKKNDLKQIIFNNSVVEYDFEHDTIAGFDSKLPGRPFLFYKIGKRFIVTLNTDKDVFIHNTVDKQYQNMLKQLEYLITLLSKDFGFTETLNKIHYVPTYEAAKEANFQLSTTHCSYGDPLYHTILKFEDYEIWLPHSYSVKGNAFKSQFMIDLLKYFKQDTSFFNKINSITNNDIGIQTFNLN